MPDSEGVEPAEELSDTELVARLRPGGAWELGFLGMDESLDDVLTRDAKTMEQLGVSYNDLADALDKVLKKALEIYLQPVTFDPNILPPPDLDIPDFHRRETIPHFDLANLPDINIGFLIDHLQVFLVVFKSWQDCPWGCEAHSRSDFMIVNRETGESVTGPELMPHLIRTHHFFGGLRSPYRTGPEQLASVLQVATGPGHR